MIETPTTASSSSLWLATAAATDYRPVPDGCDVDVAVIGGGIAGLTTALLLKREGARVAVLEAERVGTGVTGCTTAKVSALQSSMYSTIRRAKGGDAAAAYAAASLAAVDVVASVVDEEVIDCDLERRPAVTYALTEQEQSSVEKEYDAALAAGVPVDRTDVADLPFPTYGAVTLVDQLQLHPVRYVQGLARAVHGGGSIVCEHTRVLGVTEGSPCAVSTTSGTVRAGHVVIATHY